VLTGRADDQIGTEAVQAGAQDFLLKSDITGVMVVRSLRYAIERQRTAEAMRPTL
jgi:FixJ family two-component response regulator